MGMIHLKLGENMKKVLIIILFITPILPAISQSRIESTQWFTNSGHEDAMETEVFDKNNRKTYNCAQMGGTIIYTYIISYEADRIIKYNLRGEISSIEEKGYKETTTSYYRDGEISFKTIHTDLGNDKKRFVSIDLPENKIDEAYDYYYKDGFKVIEWLNPQTLEYLRTETKIETSDNDNYTYNRIYDTKGRVITEEAYKDEIMVYLKTITYTTSEEE